MVGLKARGNITSLEIIDQQESVSAATVVDDVNVMETESIVSDNEIEESFNATSLSIESVLMSSNQRNHIITLEEIDNYQLPDCDANTAFTQLETDILVNNKYLVNHSKTGRLYLKPGTPDFRPVFLSWTHDAKYHKL